MSSTYWFLFNASKPITFPLVPLFKPFHILLPQPEKSQPSSHDWLPSSGLKSECQPSSKVIPLAHLKVALFLPSIHFSLSLHLVNARAFITVYKYMSMCLITYSVPLISKLIVSPTNFWYCLRCAITICWRNWQAQIPLSISKPLYSQTFMGSWLNSCL